MAKIDDGCVNGVEWDVEVVVLGAAGFLRMRKASSMVDI